MPLVLQPLTRELADSLDVHHDIPVDLANSRTCGSHNSVLAEAAVHSTVPLNRRAHRPTNNVTSFPKIMLNSRACANSVYQAFVSHPCKYEGLGTRLHTCLHAWV